MSRRITIPSTPPIKLLTISERDGVWEEGYLPLKGTVLGDLFSEVDRRTINDAIRGHEAPLRQALGISPQGALRKMPSRECGKRQGCTFYDPKKCLLLSPKMPWCFFPENLEMPEETSALVTEILSEWKQEVYVVIVREHA